MEIFIIIPIIAVIYGWMQSFPVIPTLPEGVNGVAFGNGFCDDYAPGEDSSHFDTDDNDTFNGVGGINSGFGGGLFSDDDSIIQQEDFFNDLMFDPAFSWNNFNIYHHDDDINDIGISDTLSDPFCNSFDDCCSIHSFND